MADSLSSVVDFAASALSVQSLYAYTVSWHESGDEKMLHIYIDNRFGPYMYLSSSSHSNMFLILHMKKYWRSPSYRILCRVYGLCCRHIRVYLNILAFFQNWFTYFVCRTQVFYAHQLYIGQYICTQCLCTESWRCLRQRKDNLGLLRF